MNNRYSALAAVVLMVLLGTASVKASTIVDDGPAPDAALEKRLQVEMNYRVRPGDTLRSVAFLLYGHKTWWPKVIELNPDLKVLGPETLLPSDAVVRYLGPKIGDEYVVQAGDWLIRIAEWKYGANSEWERIYQANARAIKNPSLIHAGDRLSFGPSGTIRNLNTGKLLVNGSQGIESAQAEPPLQAKMPAPLAHAPAAASVAPVANGEPQRHPAATTAARTLGLFDLLAWLLLGIVCGFVVLAVLMGVRSHMIRVKVVSPEQEPPLDVVPEVVPAPKETEVQKTHLTLVPPPPVPAPFEAHKPEEFEARKSSGHTPAQENLLASPNPEKLDRRPGYHSLISGRSKKYIK